MEKEWFKTWFNSPFYHILYKNRDKREAIGFIDTLLNKLSPKINASILDLACGKGRFAVYLANKGYNITGVDLSEESIKYAQQFEKENLSFFTHDMRQLFRINYFDFVFNFFTSFGYFDQEKDDLKALKNVSKGLKKEGIFVLDFFNSVWVREQLIGEEEKVIDNIHFRLKKFIQDQYVFKKIVFEFNDQEHQFQERVRLFELADFEQLFQMAGLKIIEKYGDYQLNAFYEKESPRLILLGKKVD